MTDDSRMPLDLSTGYHPIFSGFDVSTRLFCRSCRHDVWSNNDEYRFTDMIDSAQEHYVNCPRRKSV